MVRDMPHMAGVVRPEVIDYKATTMGLPVVSAHPPSISVLLMEPVRGTYYDTSLTDPQSLLKELEAHLLLKVLDDVV
jgi:hypothetical protein